MPPQGRKRILEELHEAHPGVKKVKSLARYFVQWPKIDGAIEELVCQCPSCQLILETPPKVPLRPWSWPDAPWKRVHVDFFGPFWGQIFLVVVNAYSK